MKWRIRGAKVRHRTIPGVVGTIVNVRNSDIHHYDIQIDESAFKPTGTYGWWDSDCFESDEPDAEASGLPEPR